jgi:recombination protein RecT
VSEIAKTCSDVIDMGEERFNKIAPTHMDFNKEKGFAIQVLENNSYLKKVALENKASLLQAITNVAAIQLSLNPAKKQAYLIPRNVKIGNSWQSRVYLEVSYMGFCDMATSTGVISWIQANTVYSEDDFLDNGPGREPAHTYNPFAKQDARGEFVGAYCVAKTKEGDFLTTIMTAEEIDAIKNSSESVKAFKDKNRGNGGPWMTDFKEMAKKTVVRNAFKMWPKTKEMDRLGEAVQISNENEGFEPILTSPETGQYTADQKEYFDQIITNSDGMGMHVLQKTIQEGVFNNLYHSFEKGSKGKNQRLVNSLILSGSSEFTGCVDAISEFYSEGNEEGIKEIILGLSDDAMSLVTNELGVPESALILELRGSI